jgi:hypothetical protein
MLVLLTCCCPGNSELRCVLASSDSADAVEAQAGRRPMPPIQSTLLPGRPLKALMPPPVPALFSFAMLTQANVKVQVLHSSSTPTLFCRSMSGMSSTEDLLPAAPVSVTFLQAALAAARGCALCVILHACMG